MAFPLLKSASLQVLYALRSDESTAHDLTRLTQEGVQGGHQYAVESSDAPLVYSHSITLPAPLARMYNEVEVSSFMGVSPPPQLPSSPRPPPTPPSSP